MARALEAASFTGGQGRADGYALVEADGARLHSKVYRDPRLAAELYARGPDRLRGLALLAPRAGSLAGEAEGWVARGLAPPLALCRCHDRSVVVSAPFVDGVNLEGLVAGVATGSVQPVSEAAARRAALRLALVVARLHSVARLVHGDLRPENVIVARRALTPVVVDLDGARPPGEKPLFHTDPAVIAGAGLPRPANPAAADGLGLTWSILALAASTSMDAAREYLDAPGRPGPSLQGALESVIGRGAASRLLAMLSRGVFLATPRDVYALLRSTLGVGG